MIGIVITVIVYPIKSNARQIELLWDLYYILNTHFPNEKIWNLCSDLPVQLACTIEEMDLLAWNQSQGTVECWWAPRPAVCFCAWSCYATHWCHTCVITIDRILFWTIRIKLGKFLHYYGDRNEVSIHLWYSKKKLKSMKDFKGKFSYIKLTRRTFYAIIRIIGISKEGTNKTFQVNFSQIR